MPSGSSRSLLVALSALVAVAGCGRRIGEPSERDGGAVASTAPTATPAPARAPSTEGWNSAQIAWQPYEAGLAQAKAQNKPVCLVFSTTWCPHCKNYSHVFEDPRVVAQAHDFVMVHLDSDAQETIASRYAIDGSYIPRTFFLAPDGKVDATIHAPRPTSRYFYDEHDPSSLLAAMDTAHRKLVTN